MKSSFRKALNPLFHTISTISASLAKNVCKSYQPIKISSIFTRSIRSFSFWKKNFFDVEILVEQSCATIIFFYSWEEAFDIHRHTGGEPLEENFTKIISNHKFFYVGNWKIPWCDVIEILSIFTVMVKVMAY